MLTITICVGSSCSVRGADELAAELEKLIAQENLSARIALAGAFCMEICSKGVSVRVGDRQYREVRPQEACAFFYQEIVPVLKPESES
jgi:NADH:ubiquinone oxidoreductase subunit E